MGEAGEQAQQLKGVRSLMQAASYAGNARPALREVPAAAGSIITFLARSDAPAYSKPQLPSGFAGPSSEAADGERAGSSPCSHVRPALHSHV